MRTGRFLAAAVVAAAGVGACAAPAPPPTVTPSSTMTAVTSPTPSERSTPAGATLWLCRPGLAANPCEGDLATTVYEPLGGTRVEPLRPGADPRFDCFYVYPTVSKDPARTAPMAVTPELVRVVRAQAAPFQRECRLFAPVYRQVTLAGLFGGGYTDPSARAQAQRDVAEAFQDYLANYSEGRDFLLLGHSQGAQVLTTLVQSTIDGNPSLRSRLVSAMLIGGSVTLDGSGADRGSFQNVPPCRSASQRGCVIAYNTYAGTPPNSSLFGRAPGPRVVLCVNPAAPAGGKGLLDPIVPVPSRPGAEDVVGFASFPRSVVAECRSDGEADWLQAARTPGSRLPVAAVTPDRGPAWGLHRVDVTLALGTLIDLAASQARG